MSSEPSPAGPPAPHEDSPDPATAAPAGATGDALLREFLEAPLERAEVVLGRVLAEHAMPVVREVVRSRVHRPAGGAGEADDVEAEVLFQLVRRLRHLRDAGGGTPIADLRGYAAVVAYRACANRHHRLPRGSRWAAPAEAGWLEALPDPRESVAAEVARRAMVRALWAEIRQLPVRQRAALLLNLRDAAGRSALALLPLTRTAAVRDIAAAVELAPLELAALWPRLPLEDLEIAGLLGITRQQVINLRKAARARLARRMQAWR